MELNFHGTLLYHPLTTDRWKDMEMSSSSSINSPLIRGVDSNPEDEKTGCVKSNR